MNWLSRVLFWGWDGRCYEYGKVWHIDFGLPEYQMAKWRNVACLGRLLRLYFQDSWAAKFYSRRHIVHCSSNEYNIDFTETLPECMP